MHTNEIFTAGGYSGTATANTDIMPTLKAAELAAGKYIAGTWFLLREFSIKPTSDTSIKINDGTVIPVTAALGYSNNSTNVQKLEFTTTVAIEMAYNY